MKFTSTILALLAASTAVVAVDLSGIPTCALTCIVSAIAKAGCSTTDYQCQCVEKSSQITTDAAPCISSGCSTADQAKVQPAVASVCAAALSSSVSLPTVSVASSGSATAKSATVTSAPSGTASKAAATATSTGVAADSRGMGAAVLGMAALVMAI